MMHLTILDAQRYNTNNCIFAFLNIIRVRFFFVEHKKVGNRMFVLLSIFFSLTLGNRHTVFSSILSNLNYAGFFSQDLQFGKKFKYFLSSFYPERKKSAYLFLGLFTEINIFVYKFPDI